MENEKHLYQDCVWMDYEISADVWKAASAMARKIEKTYLDKKSK